MVLFVSESTSIARQLNRGREIAEHNRRSTWVWNFLAAGGIELVDKDDNRLGDFLQCDLFQCSEEALDEAKVGVGFPVGEELGAQAQCTSCFDEQAQVPLLWCDTGSSISC